jgi:enoyl-CoA hydratase
MSGTLHVSRPHDRIVRMEIDSPPTNPLGESLRVRFAEELDAIENDLDVRVLIITGHGKAFCSGDDLREAQERGDDALSSLGRFAQLLDRIERLRVPVIAAINGYAIGGGFELTLCCDLRIASEDAWFLAAGVNVGLMASVYRLPRLIGVGPAKAMVLTGERVATKTAHHYGLIIAVHPPEELDAAALTLGVRIATRAPLSIEASKRMLGRALDLSADEQRSEAAKEAKRLVESNDHAEAVAAFFDKREPKFTRS